MIVVRSYKTGALLPVKVVPNSSQSCIDVPEADETALRVRVQAVPDKGQANTAVCRLLASVLAVPKQSVVVHRGQTSRQKQIWVSTLTPAQVLEALHAAIGGEGRLVLG